ncbi:MAG: pantoate--beta-alanine ligase [Candidatus Omnitrophica bacterium]|nr:pantoate--beta-alanine ligase [Candidatus Omnitrophota bacterium]
MKIVRDIKEMRQISKKERSKGNIIGFVPTMGYLHQGHISLAEKSVKECEITVMSIYVNPLQFGPQEDFLRYPRNLKKDMELAKKAGVDYLFVPNDSQMYPVPFLSAVEVNTISEGLCGKLRPGHFKGVATVVNKLFNIVEPDIAYFGQKDAQQAAIIKKMAFDLNMPVKIKVLPIVREKDGLAMSSRNTYLNQLERKDAVILYESLRKACSLIEKGERRSAVIAGQMKRLINKVESARISYIAIVDAEDLRELKIIKNNTLIAVAGFVGKVRLIDNIVIKIKNQKPKTKNQKPKIQVNKNDENNV